MEDDFQIVPETPKPGSPAGSSPIPYLALMIQVLSDENVRRTILCFCRTRLGMEHCDKTNKIEENNSSRTRKDFLILILPGQNH